VERPRIGRLGGRLGRIVPTPGLAVAGFAIAFVASWCGIGGGLFAAPLLHYGFGVELRRSVATGLVLVVATAFASTAAQLARPEPLLELVPVLSLAGGTLIGAQLGFAFAERVPLRTLRLFFVVVLALAGTRLLAAGAPSDGLALEPGSVPAALVAVAIGVAGGFLSPLLGVGGGLVMVPALFLTLPGLGFDGARASGLAAGVIAGGRSLALHARAGRVDWLRGRWLGAGALAGAASGVAALERMGDAQPGRVVLGALLWLVALRFLADLVRPGSQA